MLLLEALPPPFEVGLAAPLVVVSVGLRLLVAELAGRLVVHAVLLALPRRLLALLLLELVALPRALRHRLLRREEDLVGGNEACACARARDAPAAPRGTLPT